MEFIIHPEIFDYFPGLHLPVAIAYGLDNATPRPAITAQRRAVWAEAAQAAVYGNAQSHPLVRPWRARFQAMGVSGKEFPSSIEAMPRRALKGGEPFHINPLVDFYDRISRQYVVPAGGFDLDQLHGPLEWRLTRSGDTFTALDADTPLAVSAGEIAYASGPTILIRHFVWRQARTGLISATTRNVILVSEVLPVAGREVAEAVLAEFRAGLQTCFGVVPHTALLHAHCPAVATSSGPDADCFR